jgi:hypothetical protein
LIALPPSDNGAEKFAYIELPLRTVKSKNGAVGFSLKANRGTMNEQ